MRYLVTGGAGFIGSHLVDALLLEGHDVVAIDNLSTGRLDNIKHAESNSNFTFVQDDLESIDLSLLGRFDFIFHLAAVVGVDLVVKHPARTIASNLHGTESVLKVAVLSGAKLFLASTSEVYGRSKGEFCESDNLRLGPSYNSRWSYAASKITDECMAFAYQQECGLEVIVARFFNTVGPRQVGNYGMVIPRFVNAARKNESLQVYGDGSQSRCFCHVEDTVRAIVGLHKTSGSVGGIFNIGTTEPITIKDLAEKIIDVLGSNSDICFVPYDEAYGSGFEEMFRRKPNTDRINKLIGWCPDKSLDDMIIDVNKYFSEGIVNDR